MRRLPNLFATLAKNRRLFLGWLAFAAQLMPFGSLARRETELVILRVAHLRGCTYERDHHERLGARAGLSAEELARVARGPSADGWSPRDRLLLEAADALVTARALPDALWSALGGELDEPARIELVMLAGHYDMLATVIAALRVPRDAPTRP